MDTASEQSRKWNERPSAAPGAVPHSDSMFEILFERSTDAIWLYDPAAASFIDCNDAAVKMMRARSKEQLLLYPPAELQLPLQKDTAIESTVASPGPQGSWRCESVARRLDGHVFPVEVVSAAVTARGRNLRVVFSRDITERKRDEEALRQSQQLLASIADNISEAIYRSAPNHSLTFVNQAYLEMFRFNSLAEIQSIPRERLYADPVARARLLHLLETQEAFSHQEIEYVRKDGTHFWGLASGRVIRDPATGRPSYHVGAITDITERKKAEAEIRHLNQSLEQRIAERTAELTASEARLRTLVEHAPEAIVVFDGETGRFLSGNAHACRMYGCTMDQLTQLTPAEVSPEFQPDGRRSAEVAREMMREASAGGSPVFEWIHLHTSGRTFPSEVRLVRLPAEGQNLLRASITDNTERKRAEQTLRESEEKFRALFLTSSQGVMLHDDRQYLEVNPAAARMLGYSDPKQLLGLHPRDTSPPVQPNGEPTDVAARRHIAACKEKGSVRFDWMARRADGRDLPVEVILTRIAWGGREIIQAAVNDISERKQAEAELLKALAREKELGQLKSNFISMVSHEFRTPLGVILSSADILDSYFDQLTPEERAQQLLSIRKNTRRMASLMEEVLLLGLVESGKMEFQPAPLSLSGFCRRIIGELLSATNQTCRVDFSPGTVPDEILGDERLLNHIFNNLLSNGIKYSPEGSAVQLTVDREAHMAVFRIRDRGIGIAPSDLPWLFNAFHRGRNAGHLPGTGLGLTIVKRCVELHRGCIDVMSTLGEGTTVTVRLPLFRTP